ncbi:MAG: outer membrane protein assembly factor BamD [Desulfococcaceae bacterium]
MLVFFSFSLAGCSGGKAKELFDTAQLEELQNNTEHARRLYEEIIQKYPDSEFSQKAEQRLNALQKKEMQN